MVIIDGLGDEFIPELNGTPLQYINERLETLNFMTKNGLGGLHYPYRLGIPMGSDTAHLTIFGYNIDVEYPGRGFFEALGAGYKLAEGGVALRFNFATVVEKDGVLIIRDRRAGRIETETAKILAKDLQERLIEEGLPVVVESTTEHRGILIIKPEEGDLSWRVTDTDPHEVGMPVLKSQPFEDVSKDEREAAERTAYIINKVSEIAYKFLNNHEINLEREKIGKLKANAILARGAGKSVKLVSFGEKWGFKAAYVAAGALYKGIARGIGMDEIKVEGATGTVKTNLNAKVDGVIKALERGYDFIYLHIKAVDNLSHDMKTKEKAEFIAKIDKALRPLLDLEDIVIAVTGDHSTSSLRGRHIGQPVPIVFWSDKVRRDEAKRFYEIELANRGGLGVFEASSIIPIMMDLADRVMEYGLRPSPKPVFYIGATGEPLKIG